jgi:hypothetical protein
LLQAAGSPLWHNPPATLQLAVVIDPLPDKYTLAFTGGGVGAMGSCVKPADAPASNKISVTIAANQNVREVKGEV